ncbi:SapC family protein [Pollutimonas bauzanensis]|uniref:SapC protein n=1 Tax=Pollutimonas bauzanensis TaxID=658167 RepID=A0A1M5PZV4_9BURK|nr:SapC family protein [Pollutimonas bauzanensis]SHH07414.1 SapC protein [Pollutimonas bauzanensis]
MIFYDTPMALNRERHRRLKLDKQAGDYSYARQTNSVLLAATEMIEAAKDYPLVFVGKPGGDFTVAGLVGLRDRENLFLDDSGQWATGRYLPAFVRRYPFVLAEEDGNPNLTVCIDEKFSGFGEEKGELLFDPEGNETELLKSQVAFLQLFHAEMQRTRAFAARLAELDLLVARTIRVEHDGRQEVLDSLFVIDEQKLRDLDDAQALGLYRDGYMPWIYAHLQSLGNIERLALIQAQSQPQSSASPGMR